MTIFTDGPRLQRADMDISEFIAADAAHKALVASGVIKVVVICATVALVTAALVYFWRSSRLGTIFRLWFLAKERELRRRAGEPDQTPDTQA